MKSCDVFAMDSGYFVFTHSVTTFGAAVSMGPYFKVEVSTNEVEFGATLLRALAASREEVPHPNDLLALEKQLLAFAGYRTWSAFQRDVRAGATVAHDGVLVLIIPYDRGPEESFVPVDDRTTRCEAEAAVLGERILEAMRIGRFEER